MSSRTSRSAPGYEVDLRLIGKASNKAFARAHAIPLTLGKLGAFVGSQPVGSLGRFRGVVTDAIADVWPHQHARRMGLFGFVFMPLADGDFVALFDIRGATPVVFLGADGAVRAVADSLEAFVLAWSKGKTTLAALDDEDARPALAAWASRENISVPETPVFDFDAWRSSPP